MKLTCVVTRYWITNGDVEERVSIEQTNYRVERGYLFLGNSAASAPVDRLIEAASDGTNWTAQMGTPPAKADGHWGGRNYPKIVVSAAELARVLS